MLKKQNQMSQVEGSSEHERRGADSLFRVSFVSLDTDGVLVFLLWLYQALLYYSTHYCDKVAN